jgi:acid phosphatase family membrane protein YuiD
MHNLKALFTNYWLMSTVFGWLVAQILKVFTGVFRERDFSLRSLIFGTGGMPSSHTASVTALCTAIVVTHGFGSYQFAMSALLCIIVMNDATGVRRETGEQSKALNIILEKLFTDPPENLNENYRELIGHTPLQVFCGAVTGILVALLTSLLPVFA